MVLVPATQPPASASLLGSRYKHESVSKTERKSRISCVQANCVSHPWLNPRQPMISLAKSDKA